MSHTRSAEIPAGRMLCAVRVKVVSIIYISTFADAYLNIYILFLCIHMYRIYFYYTKIFNRISNKHFTKKNNINFRIKLA